MIKRQVLEKNSCIFCGGYGNDPRQVQTLQMDKVVRKMAVEIQD